jgi:hypothetical protein
MNLKQVKDLSILIENTRQKIDKMLNNLSNDEKEKVQDIIKDVDKNDINSIEAHLKKIKNA